MSKKESSEKRGRKPVMPIRAKIAKYTNNGEREYNYPWGFFVNQKVVVENRWNIDVIDVMIFLEIERFIREIDKSFHNKDNFNDEDIDNESGFYQSPDHQRWYFVSENKIIKDLPLVPLSNKNSVYRRIGKLIDCGLIERKPDNRSTGKKLIRLGHNAKLFDLAKTKYNNNDSN